VDHRFKISGVVGLKYQSDNWNIGEGGCSALCNDPTVRFSGRPSDFARPNSLPAALGILGVGFVVPHVYALMAASEFFVDRQWSQMWHVLLTPRDMNLPAFLFLANLEFCAAVHQLTAIIPEPSAETLQERRPTPARNFHCPTHLAKRNLGFLQNKTAEFFRLFMGEIT
jgi:hypothetical protein